MRRPQPGDRWIWVSTRRATFALVVNQGQVVDAAPYARRFLGWDEHRAAKSLQAAGAVFRPLPDITTNKEAPSDG